MIFLTRTLSFFLAATSLLAAQLSFAALTPDDLGVIINDSDPASVEIANYYQQRRGIPASNMIHVSFPASPTTAYVGPEIIDQINTAIDTTAPHVQALAIAWTAPYRVGCMSITSALARGYDPAVCASQTEICLYPSRPNPYFDSNTSTPYTTHGLRPSMMLAGTSVEKVKALIDRGIASDNTHPDSTGYLLKTSDLTRSLPRSCAFQGIVDHLGVQLNLEYINANSIQYKPDVFLYFTGIATVPDINTNTFIPGAIADHLTSCGGIMTDSNCNQTTVLNWLEDGAEGTGATASYGAVREPCNYTEKFPSPRAVIQHYLAGDTVIEAYWKSVIMPDEGVFVGEPLATPFK